jgi:hypothetical protein
LYLNDPEILGITEQVGQATQDAAWFIVPFEPLGGGSVYGMLIEYDPNDALATPRAIGLVSALKRIGLEVHGPMASLRTSRIVPVLLGHPDQHVDASIRLMIGKKPL